MNAIQVPKAVLWVALIMLVMSMPGVFERIFDGHFATQTPQYVPWGLWVAAYTFFSGISAGCFVVIALPYVFDFKRFKPFAPLAILSALVSLIVALIYVVADLGHPERSWHIMMSPNFRSMMAWVITLYTVYGSALVGLLLFSLRPGWHQKALANNSRLAKFLSFGYDGSEKSERKNNLALKILAFCGMIFALGLAGGVGGLFSVLGTRGLWHSGLFPITFTVSALLSGISFVLAVSSLMMSGGNEFKQTILLLGRIVGFLLIGEILILVAEAIVIINGGIPEHLNTIRAIAAGPYPWVFWGLQVGIGIVAALLLLFLPKRPSIAATAVASLFVLIGVCAFRLNFVIPELATNEFAISENRTQLYVPASAEWELVIFGVGLVGLLLIMGQKYLPLFMSDMTDKFNKHFSRMSRTNDKSQNCEVDDVR